MKKPWSLTVLGLALTTSAGCLDAVAFARLQEF